MEQRFDTFVMLSSMRTGSNQLEANLQYIPGVRCYGELFNPYFIGYLGQESAWDVSLEQRQDDPLLLLNALKRNAPEISGFRYFDGHDPRVMDIILNDPRCAKIILTRNPLESYISLKIVQETNQWRLGHILAHKNAKAVFDADEYEKYLRSIQNFRQKIAHSLKCTGQSAFYIDYEDINNFDVLRGLSAFLGGGEPQAIGASVVKQNPAPLSEKVLNFKEMESALSKLDILSLSHIPNFEPKYNFSFDNIIAARSAALMFLPIDSGIDEAITTWLSQFSGLSRNFDQNTMRSWQIDNPGCRRFTVIQHPVARAYQAFAQHNADNETLGLDLQIGRIFDTCMPRLYKPYPTIEVYRAGFISFLKWLKLHLNGQTDQTTLPIWATQSALIDVFSNQIGPPDLILRTDRLSSGLAFLCDEVGEKCPPLSLPENDKLLEKIYDAEIEKTAQDTYGQDYAQFGFGAWQKTDP